MNTDRILQVADLIENAPREQFHMGSWFGVYHMKYATENSELKDLWEPDNEAWNLMKDQNVFDVVGSNIIDSTVETMLKCNTTACIAGWALVGAYNSGFKYSVDAAIPVAYNAQVYLGLTDEEAQQLFYCEDNSVWAKVADEYGFEFDCHEVNEWNINPKHVADVLRRIAYGQISLSRGWGPFIDCPTCRNEYGED